MRRADDELPQAPAHKAAEPAAARTAAPIAVPMAGPTTEPTAAPTTGRIAAPAVSPIEAPPRLARLLLRTLLRAEARSAIVGDLDEEFVCYAQPQLGTRRARRWYWDQTWRSIVACRLGLPDPPPHPERPTLRLALTQEREAIMSDVKYAIRQLAASPLFSVLVVVILALGIGANTAVFSVTNALLLRPLPVAHASRLVFVHPPPVTPLNAWPPVTFAAYQALTRDAAGFATLAAISIGAGRRVTLDQDGARATVTFASGNAFDTLGVAPPVLGRFLTPDDDRPGAAPVAVLDYSFWQRQFGGDRGVVGRVIRLNDEPCTIVGVAPREFFGIVIGSAPDAWLPLVLASTVTRGPAAIRDQYPWLQVVGTIAADAPRERAQASAASAWRERPGPGDAAISSASHGNINWLSREYSARLLVLSGLVALVLVVGCLNIATLLGARSMSREREFGIRAALGAGRGRLLRQLVVEHALLAGLGGVAGLALGSWLARGLVTAMSDRSGPLVVDLSLDRHVLLFALGLSLLTALAFGLVPALQAARVDLLGALTGRWTMTPRPSRLRLAGSWWLVPAQVALGCVVLVAAALFVRTFQGLHRTVGVTHTDQVLLVDVGFDGRLYQGAAVLAMLDRIRHEVGRIPGVSVVGLSTMRPLSRMSAGPVFIPGVESPRPIERTARPSPPPPPPPQPGAKGAKAPFLGMPWVVGRSYVSAGFVPALGLSVVRGRDFTDADGPGSTPVVIINETLAGRAFPGQNPIGRRIQTVPFGAAVTEIVGVVADLNYEHLREVPPDAVFLPLTQRETPGAASPWSWDSDLTLYVRTAGDAHGIEGRVRGAIQALDARLPISRVWTFEDEISNALIHERLAAQLATVMGGLALVLAVAGIYGVVSYAVARRTREMGVRLALGATPGAVRLMVIRESVAVVAIGLVAGLPLANILTRYVRHLLYGVEPSDPTAALIAAALLFLTALIAAFLPAQRASRVDPVTALRAE